MGLNDGFIAAAIDADDAVVGDDEDDGNDDELDCNGHQLVKKLIPAEALFSKGIVEGDPALASSSPIERSFKSTSTSDLRWLCLIEGIAERDRVGGRLNRWRAASLLSRRLRLLFLAMPATNKVTAITASAMPATEAPTTKAELLDDEEEEGV
jgi:hypothetical protein